MELSVGASGYTFAVAGIGGRAGKKKETDKDGPIHPSRVEKEKNKKVLSDEEKTIRRFEEEITSIKRQLSRYKKGEYDSYKGQLEFDLKYLEKDLEKYRENPYDEAFQKASKLRIHYSIWTNQLEKDVIYYKDADDPDNHSPYQYSRLRVWP